MFPCTHPPFYCTLAALYLSYVLCCAAQQRLRPLRSTGTDERSTGTTDERLKSTLADLDALLGIKEEEQQEEAKVRGDALSVAIAVGIAQLLFHHYSEQQVGGGKGADHS
jgi:hypothetical protein